eukprot:PhM_4_TR10817/c0_g1_i1/m.6053/K15711/SMARCA3, HLTF; SWI/SNF-related matrix-associated actin-dependent regulator of chromatin subfamily A3
MWRVGQRVIKATRSTSFTSPLHLSSSVSRRMYCTILGGGMSIDSPDDCSSSSTSEGPPSESVKPFYDSIIHADTDMTRDVIDRIVQPSVDKMKIDLMPFQREGVAWMVRRELSATGGVLADHLGMGKTVQLIGLCLANPLKMMTLDHRFAMQVIASAGSVTASRIERMVTVTRILQRTSGIGTCSRLSRPGMDLMEMRIKMSDIANVTKGLDVDAEAQCLAMLEPWLVFTKKLYPHYERKCRQYIVSASSVSKPSTIDTPELRTLIVAPAAILMQWRQELVNKVADSLGLRVIIFHGEKVRQLSPEEIESYDFVLTTYDTLASCVRLGGGSSKEGGRLAFGSDNVHGAGALDELPRGQCGAAFNVHWKRIILDEAHVIRHKNTGRWQAIRHLMGHKRWCVTATPLHNSLNDLQSLLNFIDAPELPISTSMDSSIFLTDVSLQRSVARSLQETFLRREPTQQNKAGETVTLVSLPAKHDEIVYCDLSPAEAEQYNAVVARCHNFLKRTTQGNNTLSVFTMLTRLRQLCCHSWLLDGVDLTQTEHICAACNLIADSAVTAGCGHIFCRSCLLDKFSSLHPRQQDPEAITMEEEILRIICPVEGCGHGIPKNVLTDSNLTMTSRERRSLFSQRTYESSSKVDTLMETLREIRDKHPGDKVVVFTHFVTFMDILELALTKEGIAPLRLDGSMSPESRAGTIRLFQEVDEHWVLLASKMATGVGLNLTMANHVVVLDPWWNPAIEEQAVHRCHRIGQNKEVFVKRFIVSDSVEEMCLDISTRKKELGELVLKSAMTGKVDTNGGKGSGKKTKRGPEARLQNYLRQNLTTITKTAPDDTEHHSEDGVESVAHFGKRRRDSRYKGAKPIIVA